MDGEGRSGRCVVLWVLGGCGKEMFGEERLDRGSRESSGRSVNVRGVDVVVVGCSFCQSMIGCGGVSDRG